MKTITIYTDGACQGNPGPGGWGAVLLHEQGEETLSGAEHDTTNNRMEILAAIQGLSALQESHAVALYTDSNYLKKGITEWIHNWKRKNWRTASNKPVKNVDLWQQLDELNAKHSIEWHWVKAHAGNHYNEMADSLATGAIATLYD